MNFCATLIRRGGAWSLSSSAPASLARLAALLLVLSIVGCTSNSGIDRSAIRKSAATEQAFVFPPIGGPPIVGVIEEKRSGNFYQEILLGTNAATPGQNRIEVTVSRNAHPPVNPYPRIAREMRAALPSVRMNRSPFYVQNRYGPFGYAFGRGADRDLCLFGWQSIRTKASPMTNQGAIDVRLRLCETGATEQKLLSVMYGYTIDVFMASPQWNPYGDPLPPAPELGKPGPDMLPAGPDQFATVTTPVPLARRAKRPSRPAGSQEQAAPPAAAVQPSGPRVPAPPAKPGSDEAAEPAAQAPLVPPPPAEE